MRTGAVRPSRLWVLVGIIGGIGIIWWTAIHDGGYSLEVTSHGSSWLWIFLAVLALASWRSERSVRWVARAVVVLLVLDMLFGFVYRQHFSRAVAQSKSPTGAYEVSVDDSVGFMDTNRKIRVIRHSGIFDFRYSDICGSDIGDQVIIAWVDNSTFTVATSPDSDPLRVSITGNRLGYKKGFMDWGRC